MDIRRISYFHAVSEEASFSAAARKLRVAQPAISSQIKDLEEELGFKLFLRLPRESRLTPAGKRFYEDTKKFLENLEQSIESAQMVSRGEVGRLRVGFLAPATSAFLPSLVRDFRRTYPGVHFHLDEGNPRQHREALKRNEVDLALSRQFSAHDPEFESWELYRDQHKLIVPGGREGGRLAQALRKDDFQCLDGRDFVLVERTQTPAPYEVMERLSKKHRLNLRVQREVRDMPSLLASVESGLALGIASGCLEHYSPFEVQYVSLKDKAFEVPLLAYWRKDSADPALDSFVDYMKSRKKDIQKIYESP